MKLIRRLSESVSAPSRLSAAVNDRGIFTFLYTLILVLIMIIPYIVTSFTVFDIDYNTQVEIRNAFYNEKIEFKINNGVLEKTGESDYYFNDEIIEGVGIYVSSNNDIELENSSVTTVIAFLADGVYFGNSIAKQEMIKYSDFEELNNLDFNSVKDNMLEFWNPVFNVVQKLLDQNKGLYVTLYILSSIFQALVMICLYSLIFTIFNRIGVPTHLKFKDHWKLSIYGVTGFVLGNTLSLLFNFSLLYYIGFIVSIVVCFISSKNFIIRGGNNEL